MTDYIEEMMRTAGVKPKIYKIPSRDFYNDSLTWETTKEYPDFTPKKQLEIIKFAGELDYTSFGSLLDFEINVNGLDFSQALAQLTTELMKAGELDKEKIKEVLEG